MNVLIFTRTSHKNPITHWINPVFFKHITFIHIQHRIRCWNTCRRRYVTFRTYIGSEDDGPPLLDLIMRKQVLNTTWGLLRMLLSQNGQVKLDLSVLDDEWASRASSLSDIVGKTKRKQREGPIAAKEKAKPLWISSESIHRRSRGVFTSKANTYCDNIRIKGDLCSNLRASEMWHFFLFETLSRARNFPIGFWFDREYS